MTNKIHTIEDASKVCLNTIRLVGELKELSIDLVNQNDNIHVNYVGVVKVNDSYIKIHGSTNNLSRRFKSDTERLNELKANIYATFRNGDVVDTIYSDECSVVYIEGKVSSANSVRVDYISNSTSGDTTYILGAITGIPIEIVDENIIKVLVINNNFHNVLTFKCDRCNITLNTLLNQTVNFGVEANDNKSGSPLSLEYKIKLIDGIPQNLIDNAIAEHNIYLSTRKQNG